MQKLYILDTSILYQLCQTHGALPGGDRTKDAWKGKLAERVLAKEDVVVPENVLIEILGQLMHERIGDFSTEDLNREELPNENGGYQDYLLWYRRRQIVANRFIHAVLDPEINVELWQRERDLEQEALALTYDWLTPLLFRDIISFYQSRLKTANIELRPREPKCLDGMDGQILFDAIQIARSKQSSKCIFLTEDRVLHHVVKDIRRRSNDLRSKMPANLSAERLSDYSKHR